MEYEIGTRLDRIERKIDYLMAILEPNEEEELETEEDEEELEEEPEKDNGPKATTTNLKIHEGRKTIL